MSNAAPHTIYLRDYAPPPFLVERNDMDIDLRDDHAHVAAKMLITRNPASTDTTAALVLDGDSLELLSVAIDGHALAADAWVLTGSVASVTQPEPWMERTADALRQRHAAGRALVGLCFGHQLIAQALGGTVGRNAGGFRLGVANTALAAHEPWMDPPLPRLSLFAAHEDQVQQPPPGARVLGGNAFCPVGAYAIGRHVLCTQYHPELTRPFMRDLLATFGHKFGAPVVAQAAGEIEQPVDADTFMRWAAQFIERSLQAPASP
jgi:GMP synthase (glutamine-hydrolysing)